MKAWGQFATVWILALWSAPVMAIAINDFTAARNDRFASGYVFTSGTLTSLIGPLVANTDPSFIGAGYDWSGVGWNNSSLSGNQCFALITPRQMLIENHYQPGVGTNIQFVSATGQLTTVTVQSQPGTHSTSPTYASDMATAVFSNPIPQSAGLTTYSILFQGYNPSAYVGYNLLNYGQTAAIGWNQIASVNTGTGYAWGNPFSPDPAYYMNYLYDTTTPGRTQLIGGDSGSPSFIVTGSPGVMYLAGAHYVTGTGGGWDSFLPMSLPALDSDTAPSGYLLSVVTPTTARWISTSSGAWGTGGNWSSGAVPNDVLTSGQVTTCASVLFDASASSQHTITLGGNEAVTSLAFNLTPAASGGFTFNGSTLTLGEAGLTNNDVHTQTFNNAIVLRASQQWNAGSGGLTISALGSLSLGTSQLLYLNSAGTSDFEGVISGASSSLAKDGSGTLILGNANNSFSGQIFIHNGTIQFASIQNVGGGPSALGAPTTAANGTIYLAGTMAYVGGGNSSNRVIDVADGPGASGATGIIDASGSGPLNLTGGVTCEDAAGTSLLVLQGSGSGSQSGAVVNSGGTTNVMSLVKTQSGTWNLSGANTYTGTTTVNGGLLTISGAAGAIGQSAALTVSGGSVQLDDSALANNFSSNRLGSQPISLQGGALQINLGSVSGGTETIGSLTAAAGENTVALSAGGGSGILGGASLIGMPGATLNFTGPLSSTNRVVFGGMPSGSNFIDAGTFVNGADYAVYDAGGYVRAMVAGPNASDYATSVATSRHVLLTTAVTSQPSVTLLTLSLSGASSGFSLASGQTLTLSNGGILKTGGGMATVGGGAGLSTAGEYVLRTDTASDQLTIATPLGGGTGLTKSGLGTLVLASGNSYGGPTTIDAGTLKTTAAAAIPSTSPLVIANAAALDLGGQSQTVAGITLYDGAIENSGPAAVLTLGGNAAGVTYGGNGNGNGSSISGGTLDLASAGSSSASHTFSVARGQGSADLNVLADIADGSASSQALVKTGNGILQLSGANTFTGGTQIEAGTLTLGSNQAIPAASSLTLSAGTLDLGGYANTASTLVMKNGLITGNGSFSAASFNLQNGTVAGSLAGPGSISITASGVVTITGSNSYSGGTKLSGGTLTVSADNNLGAESGALTLDGGMLQVEGTSFSATTRPVTTTANGGTISVVDPNNTLTLATQNLNGSGAFTKAGQGGLQLGGSIGSTAITVQDGTLQLTGSASQLTANPALTLWNVATFSFSNHNESVSAINLTGGTINTGTGTLNLTGSLTYAQSIWPATIQGNLALGAAAGAFSVTQGDSTDLTVAANISGSPAGGLVKTGNGLLTLTGSNTYSNTTSVNQGTLAVAGTMSLPGYTSGLVSVAPGAVLAVQSGDGTTGWSNAQIGALLGDVNWANNTAFGIDTTNGNSTYCGTIGNSTNQALGLTKLGANTLTLTGSETYAGTTTISSGTLQLGDGTCDPSLATNGINISANTALLYNVAVSQTAGYPISGNGALIKAGPGTLTMTNASTFGLDGSSIVSIHQGAINVSSGGSLMNLSEIDVGDTATQTGALALSGGTADVTLANSGWSGVNVGYNGGTGQVTMTGNSAINVTTTNGGYNVIDIGFDNNSCTGSAGTVTVGGNSTMLANGGSHIAVGDGGTGVLIIKDSGVVQASVFELGTTDQSGQNGGSGTLQLNGGTLSVPQVQNAAGTTGNLYFNGGTLQATASSGDFLQSSGGGTLNAYVQAGGAVIDTNGNNITINQVLAHDPNDLTADGGLTKVGSGTITLTAANTYNGGTTVNAGTLAVSSSANMGTGGLTFGGSGGGVLNIIGSTTFTSSNAIALSQNGTIQADDSAGATLSGVISGSGELIKTGSGVLTLTGTNTYSGGTTVASGTLQVLDAGALPDGGLIVGAGGTFSFDPNSDLQSPVTAESLDIYATGGGSLGSSDPTISPVSALDSPALVAATAQPGLNSVPEPGTLLLVLAAGGGGLLWAICRKMDLRLVGWDKIRAPAQRVGERRPTNPRF